jgi:hypothetical protein
MANRSKRWLIAGALALAPVAAAVNLSATPAVPFVNGIPWCCAVRGDINQKANLPTPAARPLPDRLRNRRFKPGRYTGAARRKTPRGGCFHCGGPTPDALTERVGGMRHSFCSQACVAACCDYHAAGLGHVYAFGPPARVTGAAGVPAPSAAAVETRGGRSSAYLLVEGMHCGAGIWIIERAL